ncbi:MAG: hypothetical protein WCC26_12020 [Terracidiphilus sp.]
MSWRRWINRAEEPVEMDALDPAMKQALGDFKTSVRAWSEAAYHRSRTAESVVVRRSWRLAAGWSLAVALLAGTVSGGLYEHHRAQVAAQVAAQREAEQERALAAQQAQEAAQQEDDVLASVDMDVSREVPSAMEPLAQLGDEGESQ